MTDHQPSAILPDTTQNPTRSISSLIGSPRFFSGFFSPKSISPSSILETNKQIFNFENSPFRFSKNPEKLNKFKHKSVNYDSEGIALALVLFQENHNDNIIYYKPKSNLKIQIPLRDPYLNGSPDSPSDFGIKTRSSQISGVPTPTGFGSPKFCTGPLSLREMELYEEYTRVISHGPNPKTTHIFDNCVVNSNCGNRVGSEPPLESVISFCQTCKKNIGEGSDIFMYRGVRVFCSEECRCQEMVLDANYV